MKRVDHAEASSHFIKATKHLEFHDKRLWGPAPKRDREAEAIPEWEELRAAASAIKEHTLSHLADYLEQFERNAWRTACILGARRGEHNQIVFAPREARRKDPGEEQVDADRRVRDAAVPRDRGIEVVETDLGERIQQLDDEPPSHIVVPAVHKLRAM